jgi:hypothetical protein
MLKKAISFVRGRPQLKRLCVKVLDQAPWLKPLIWRAVFSSSNIITGFRVYGSGHASKTLSPSAKVAFARLRHAARR